MGLFHLFEMRKRAHDGKDGGRGRRRRNLERAERSRVEGKERQCIRDETGIRVDSCWWMAQGRSCWLHLSLMDMDLYTSSSLLEFTAAAAASRTQLYIQSGAPLQTGRLASGTLWRNEWHLILISCWWNFHAHFSKLCYKRYELLESSNTRFSSLF